MDQLSLFLYVVRFVLVGTSLGIACIKIEGLKHAKQRDRFLIGIASTPLFLSLSTYICALLWVGIPRYILFIFPVAISALYLIKNQNYKVLFGSVKEVKGMIKAVEKEKFLFHAILFAILVTFVCCFLQIFASRLYQGLYGSDESHYITQARIFYEDRNSWEIDNYEGTKWEGTVFADDHGPLWPVYLADAASIEEVFDINLLEIKVAFIFTIICMLLMIVVVGNLITGKFQGGIFSLIIYMLYHYAIRFPLGGSRDGYRMIALLFFFVVLYEILIKVHEEKEVSFGDCILLLTASYLSINGHQGNVFVMLSASLAFFSMELYNRVKFSHIIFSAVFILAGTLFGFMKNVRCYIQTGAFITTTLRAFKGTVAEDVRRALNSSQWELSKVKETYENSDRLLMIIGLSAVIYYIFRIIYFKVRKKREYTWIQMNNICLLMSFLLPLTGIFNFLGYNFSFYTFAQYRYRIYPFVFFALIGGMMLSEITHLGRRSIARWCVGLFIIYLSGIGINYLNVNYVVGRIDPGKDDLNFFDETARSVVSMSTGGNVFVGEQVAAAYFDSPPKLLFDYYARAILKAKDDREIEAAFDELDAQFFVFNWRCDPYCYDVLPFYDYLQTSDNVTHKRYKRDEKYIDIYVVDEKIWR